MWYKVRWLFFWVTMFLWLGHFWGCTSSGENQNYKILNDNRPASPTQVDPNLGAVKSTSGLLPHTGFEFVKKDQPVNYDKHLASIPAHRQQFVSQVSTDTAAAKVRPADESPAKPAKSVKPAKSASAPVAAKAAAPVTPDFSDSVELPEATKPSLKGLDRSHWKKLSSGPVVGQTQVYPHYFEDYKPARTRKPIDFKASVASQIESALDQPTSAGLWDWHQATGVVIQTAKFLFDTAALPVRVIMGEYPWQQIATPKLATNSTSSAAPASSSDAKPDAK